MNAARVQVGIEFLRAITRPLVTLALVGALIYGFVAGVVTAEAFVPIAAGVISFWFGSRQQGRD